jgi:uncharacterized protein (DUF433 family)
MDTTVAYRYITSVPGVQGGEPVIKGTRTPVRTIVQSWRRGMSPEDIVEGLPHLKLSEVFEAMSYFYDNQSEIEGLIEKHHIPEELIERTFRRK